MWHAPLTSVNWSGYAQTGTGYTRVAANWTVPTAASATTPKYSSTWIGIDGKANSDLIQTGTEQDSSGQYFAWWEILPASAQYIGNVTPGDTMQASISQTATAGVWSISISDLTSKQSASGSVNYSGPGASAEWIEERPTVGCSTCISTLADFGSVTFSGAVASGSTQLVDAVDMTDDSGNVIAYPSAMGANDTFTVTYGSPPTTTTPPPPARSGYWMLGTAGQVYAFGDAVHSGNAPLPPGTGAVHIEPTPDSKGYWVLDAAGHVYSFGDAIFAGGSPRLAGGETVTTMSATVSGNGYWLFTNTGRVIAYGDAQFFGDMSATRLNGPILDSIRTPSGKGYYMVGSDGGIFSFGDAAFHGSMGGTHLNGPVVGLAPNAGGGYWLVASDGGIFAFGGAAFRGSMGAVRLNRAIIGAAAYGDGYLMVGSDGGIFDFSNKPFSGSLGANPPLDPIIGVAALNG